VTPRKKIQQIGFAAGYLSSFPSRRLCVSTRCFFLTVLYRQINFPSERAASLPTFFAASRDLRQTGDMFGFMKFLDIISGRE